jgi:hypothetical protein
MDYYQTHGTLHTKHDLFRSIFSLIRGKNIAFVDSFDPEYAPRRKALSSAFFKNKLLLMVDTIKEVTLDYIREKQTQCKDGVLVENAPEFTKKLYCKIIINLCVGKAYADMKVPFEHPDGRITQETLSYSIHEMITATFNRT